MTSSTAVNAAPIATWEGNTSVALVVEAAEAAEVAVATRGKEEGGMNGTRTIWVAMTEDLHRAGWGLGAPPPKGGLKETGTAPSKTRVASLRWGHRSLARHLRPHSTLLISHLPQCGWVAPLRCILQVRRHR